MESLKRPAPETEVAGKQKQRAFSRGDQLKGHAVIDRFDGLMQ
jgi:hypothetical protein